MARIRVLTQEYIDTLKELGYTFRMNECNDDLEVNEAPITDGVRAVLRTVMRDKAFERVNVMEDAYIAFAQKNSYHPVKEYLWSLKHDGVDYISQIGECFTDKYGMFPTWFRKWIVGSCMRVCGDGLQNPMLVLDGGQGIGKSYFVRWLASGLPDYFVEAPIDPHNKDDFIRLVGTWIWEVAELGSTARRTDRESLKNFISTQKVVVRKAYGRYDIRKPSLASFIGTVNNESGLLSDPTGSRRFLICKIEDVDWSYSNIDVNQLWAQAMSLYAEGETNLLTEDEKARAATINEEYEMDDPIAGMLDKYFEIDLSNNDWWMPSTDVLEILVEKGLTGNSRGNAMQLSVAATRLGLPKLKRLNPNGRLVNGYRGLHFINYELPT